MKRSRIAAVAATVAVVAAATAAFATQGARGVAGDETSSIVVQGSASVSAVPDKLQLSFGVESQASTAKAALAANSAEMRKVIAAIKAAGATEVKTVSVSLSPRYREGGDIQSYAASNTVSATVATVGKAGAVIDEAVEAGANQVYGPSGSVTAQAALYRQALKGAVAEARASAQALAEAAGVTLGRVTNVVEAGGGPVYALAERARAAGDVTPIEPGTQDVSATVTVTFALS